MDILKKNFFELFNIDIAVDINKSELDEKVKALQIKFHPDKFACWYFLSFLYFDMAKNFKCFVL